MDNIFEKLRSKNIIDKNFLYFVIPILIIIAIFSVLIVSNIFFKQVELQRKAELKQKVEIAYNTILPIITMKRENKISKEEAIKRITDIVRNMTFNDEFSKNYIFMSSYDGTYLVQPFEPEKEGTNQWNYVDIKGKYIIRELVKAAKKYPQGSYVSYYSYLPHSKEYQPKLSYVKGIPEIEAYIGTGMYTQTTFKNLYTLLNIQRLILILSFLFVIMFILIYTQNLNKNYLLLKNEIIRRKQLEEELIKEKNDLINYQKQLDYIAIHDLLTGLYNYNYFTSLISSFPQNESLPLSIIMFDVNGLKLINDTMGHTYGDKLLVSFAKILLSSKRKNDIAIRIGGDEFLLILPNTNHKKAEEITDTIKRNIEKYNNNLKEKLLVLSVATGFATLENNNQNLFEIYKQADDNMYKDKLLNKLSSKNQIISVLLAALGEKDNVTKGHTDRVKKMCELMAQKLDLDDTQKNNLILLSEMHDIGKVAIPDSILNKKEPLTKREWEIIKSHSEKGYRIALASPELGSIAELILKHHEKWDGTGYPLGIKGEEIPIECRILALADAYDAMTNLRPYNKVKTHEEAIREIKYCSGTQFDPKIAEIFIELFEPYHSNSTRLN
ncbi:HD domain-containing phosphohydrolase [Caldicellulosiruptoraceae bacterium PP1]